MSWRVTVRGGGRVARSAHETLAAALDALEAAARAAAAEPEARTIDLRSRRWEPADQIATRAELAGPERWRPTVRAGFDIRGDGSVQAWTGAPTREALEADDPFAALRHAVGAWHL